MRARVFVAFVLGFAAGLLTLGLLAYTGTFRVPVPTGGSVRAYVPPPAMQPEPSAPLLAPPPTGEIAPGPTGEAPAIVAAVEPPPPPAPTGSADRITTGPPPPHLAMPLANIDPQTLHDTFSEKRDGRSHEALDIMAPRGTPVQAVADGNVVKLFTSKDGGLTVYQFDNSGNWSFYYAHLDRYARGLTEGTLLHKGQVLGYVGSTGNASPKAPHLHFAVNQLAPDKKWWTGTPIDPLPLFR